MSDKQQLKLLQSEEYVVTVGEEPFAEIKKTAALYANGDSRAVLFVDENVYKLQSELVNRIAALYAKPLIRIIPSGETAKSVEQWLGLVNFCLDNSIDRSTPVYAIGGGVTGDLAGFAASTVLRGVPLIHIPTTLLAIVDSSIGGKTGINHSTGKNLIGTFYQPKAVIAPLNALKTLDDVEFICGFGEILKYGAIADPDILDILYTKDLLELRENIPLLKSIIQRSIKVKTDIVMRDAKESKLRMILNYGHTFAHAIEKQMGYGKISHGQAVYIGIIAAGILSAELGASLKTELIEQHFFNMGIDTIDVQVNSDELIQGMKSDKKRSSQSQRFVVLKDYGRPYIEVIQDMKLIANVWNKTCSRLIELHNKS